MSALILRTQVSPDNRPRHHDQFRAGTQAKCHAAVGFRVGPADRAKIYGDVARVRQRGAHGGCDEAFAIDPAGRCSRNRFGSDEDVGLLRRRLATARGPRTRRGAKQQSLRTRRALHGYESDGRTPHRQDRIGQKQADGLLTSDSGLQHFHGVRQATPHAIKGSAEGCYLVSSLTSFAV